MQQNDFQPGLSQNPSLVAKLRQFQEDPTSLVFVSLAEEYRKAGFPRQALEILREGAFFHPDLLGAWMAEARAFTDLKRYAEALARCAQILQKSPEHIKALQLRVEIFLRLGQKSAALKSLRQIIYLFPDDISTRSQIAELENLEKTPELEKNVMADGRGGISAYQVGRLSDLHSDDRAPAQLQAQEAEEPFATRTIAELYLRQGLSGKAIGVLQRMQQLNPDDQWVKDALQSAVGKPLPTQANKVVLDRKNNLVKKARYLERALAHVQLGAGRIRSSYEH